MSNFSYKQLVKTMTYFKVKLYQNKEIIKSYIKYEVFAFALLQIFIERH